MSQGASQGAGDDYPAAENWALQKVMVAKSTPLPEAERIYKKITGRAPRKERATEEWYHFRAIPPTKFVPRSYRTKVVNDQIHLVFGRLEPESAHLVGKGFADYFKRAAAAVTSAVSITDFSASTAEILKRYGDFSVVAIQLRRVPISGVINSGLQALSGGDWERLKTKYGFDKFFHLSMVVTLQGKSQAPRGVPGAGRGILRQPKKLAIEKLNVVSVNEQIDAGPGLETLDVAVPVPFTINELFTKVRATVGDSRFFSYSGLGGNNCQDFIRMLLEALGLYSEPVALFVYQDISELVKELPASVLAIAETGNQLHALTNKYFGVGGSRRRVVRLQDLVEPSGGAAASPLEVAVCQFSAFLRGRAPTSKLYDEWVAGC